jgi:hypothetical protein
MNSSQPLTHDRTATPEGEDLPNGPAAAAILAAGAGCAALGVLAVAADAAKLIVRLLTFYLPTGPLSGVSSVAILLWLLMWLLLAKRWKTKTVAIGKISAAAFLLLADFLQGK